MSGRRNRYRATGRSEAFRQHMDQVRGQAQPHEAEYRPGLPPLPCPDLTVDEMAQQIASDPEFMAWRDAEVRGLIGRR